MTMTMRTQVMVASEEEKSEMFAADTLRVATPRRDVTETDTSAKNPIHATKRMLFPQSVLDRGTLLPTCSWTYLMVFGYEWSWLIKL